LAAFRWGDALGRPNGNSLMGRGRSAVMAGRRGPARWRGWYGAAAGVLTAAVALGVGQLISGLGTRQGAPAVAVGQAAIDLAPPPVKDFAISAFGSNDKTVLLIGIFVVLTVFAAVIGALAMRRLMYGFAGLAVFAGVGLAAALTRPGATFGYAVPTIVGAAAGAYALTRLIRAADAAAGPAVSGEPSGASVPLRSASAPPRRPPAPVADAPASPDSPPTASSDSPAAAPSDSAGPANSRSPEAAASATPASQAPGPDTSPDPPAPGPAASADPRVPEPATGTPALPESAAPVPVFPGEVQAPPPGEPPPGDRWTYQPPRRPGRRRFLIVSGVAAAAAAVTGFAGRELNARQSVTQARAALRFPRPATPAPPLPAGSDLRLPGLSPFVTPNGPFYRVDTAIILPQVAPDSWHLRVHGMVEREITISFAELLRRPLIEHYVTLTCVSDPVAGPYVGNAKWLGASLADLIREARPRAGASQLLCTSTDGFTSGTPLEAVLDGRDALLAVAMNGTPLPVEHGFPARMVIPGLYGYVSATKWVTDIKVTTFQAEIAYWVQRGWSQQAPIKTESRIDIPFSGATLSRGRTAIAGVAWAQHRGIDAVEVRVDGGPWHQATLAAVPGIDTWRQWAWYWDAAPGNHTIEARATDATGHTQTALQAATTPNGATGYPTATVTIHS
jgi:DMSO/TMAO reductase YedYZ molybdopterin-dependent catalytic subunit